MDAEDKLSQLEQLMADVTEYINLRIDALKLRIADHLSAFSGLIFGTLLGVLLLLLALLFILAGFTWWLSQALHSPAVALFITGGFILCLTILVFALRKRIFTNRMVRFFIKLFFNPASAEEPDSVKEENDEA